METGKSQTMTEHEIKEGDVVRFTDQGHHPKFDLQPKERTGTVTGLPDTDGPLVNHEIQITYETEKASVGTEADFKDIIEIVERREE